MSVPSLASLLWALALALLLMQGGACGSDPACPLGSSGPRCELTGALGAPPDVPAAPDSASDASTMTDTNEAAEGVDVFGSDTQRQPDTNTTSTPDGDDAVGDDAAGDSRGGGDQTPDADTSDSDVSSAQGEGTGDGAWGLTPPADRLLGSRLRRHA